MTIELITGTPGSGKTCYAVAKRIMAETGRQVAVEREDGGTDIVTRRIIVAGVRGLVVMHDRLPHTLTGERVSQADADKWNAVDADGEPDWKRLPGTPALVVECTLFNWWLWCRPGDLIVVDEVQFIVPRGTLGKNPPHYIKSLEIHRHYGVDFLFITQSPLLLDTTIRNLVGLHRHIRSVVSSPLCMIYEWDHSSNTERITGASKGWYWRKSEYFKLYKSTVAVVSPPSSGRGGLVMILAFMGAFLFFGNMFLGKFIKGNGQAVAAAAPSASAAAAAAASASAGQAERAKLPVLARARAEFAGRPKLTGCFTTRDACTCLDERNMLVKVEDWACKLSAEGFEGLVAYEPRKVPESSAMPYGAAASGVAPRQSAIPSL